MSLFSWFSTKGSISGPKKWKAKYLKDIDTIIFDCDGVLWRGSTVIPGSKEIITCLKDMGKKVFFVTNNSTKSRIQYMKKFRNFGIAVEKRQVVSASYASVAYLLSINFHKRSKQHKVYVIGGSGILAELDEAKIPYIWCRSITHGKNYTSVEEMTSFDIDMDVGAVLVGQYTNLTYADVVYACRTFHKNPDCLLIATNRDTTSPAPGGHILPGGGSVVSMVEVACNSKAIDCGKPTSLMLNLVKKELSNLKPERTLMIGDRLDTDIKFGNTNGLKTLLVYTGITPASEVITGKPDVIPTYVTSSVADLCGAISNL